MTMTMAIPTRTTTTTNNNSEDDSNTSINKLKTATTAAAATTAINNNSNSAEDLVVLTTRTNHTYITIHCSKRNACFEDDYDTKERNSITTTNAPLYFAMTHEQTITKAQQVMRDYQRPDRVEANKQRRLSLGMGIHHNPPVRQTILS